MDDLHVRPPEGITPSQPSEPSKINPLNQIRKKPGPESKGKVQHSPMMHENLESQVMQTLGGVLNALGSD